MLLFSFICKQLITVPEIRTGDSCPTATARHITLLDKSGNLQYGQCIYNLGNLAVLKRELAGLENDRWVIDVKRGVSTQHMIDLLDALSMIGLRHVSLGGLAL